MLYQTFFVTVYPYMYTRHYVGLHRAPKFTQYKEHF